jgi:hypothetical protein
MEDTDNNKESSKSEDSEWSSSPIGGSGMGAAMFAPLTAEYLLERGYCCGNGCKNCPYDYKAVPEPRRTLLLEQRKNNETNK